MLCFELNVYIVQYVKCVQKGIPKCQTDDATSSSSFLQIYREIFGRKSSFLVARWHQAVAWEHEKKSTFSAFLCYRDHPSLKLLIAGV